LGLPGGSNRRRYLLVEATQLAWASWVAITSLFSPINRGKRAEQKCSALLVFRILSKLIRKIVSVEKIEAEALSRRFRERFREDSSPFFIVLRSFFVVLRSSIGKFSKSNLSIHSMHP